MKAGQESVLSSKHMKMIIGMIENTCDDELDCGTVFDHLDIYTEHVLNSGHKDQLMSMIEDHLKICVDCREEFSMVLQAVKTIDYFNSSS